MLSSYEPKFIENFFWERFVCFFQILAKSRNDAMKTRLCGHHFETVQHFIFVFWNVVVISLHIHGVEIIYKIRGKVVFFQVF